MTVEKRSFAARGNFGWVVRWVERISHREVVMIVPFPSLSVGPVEELVQVCSVVKVLVLQANLASAAYVGHMILRLEMVQVEAKEIYKNISWSFPLIPKIPFKVTLLADLFNFCHVFQKLNLCRNLYHILLIRVDLDLENLFLWRLFLQIDHIFEFEHES